MKAKKGYINTKNESNTGKYLKWYFLKKTCRKNKKIIDEEIEEYYEKRQKPKQ